MQRRGMIVILARIDLSIEVRSDWSGGADL
jgi:hypothetical protein